MLASEAIAAATAELGGPIASDFGQFDMLNRAARSMESSMQWSYLTRSTPALAFRAPVDGLLASWTAATKTLTLTGAFAGFTLVPGDTVKLTNNGVEAGTHRIVTHVGDDSITLDGGPSADIAALVSFDVNVSHVGLPDDVGRIIKIYGTDSLTRQAFASSTIELTRFDTLNFAQTGFTVGYAFEWAQLTPTSEAVPTIRVYPEPAALEFDALTAIYLRQWPAINSEDSVLPLPSTGYMDALLIEYVRAYAISLDERVDLLTLLGAVEAGPIYKNAAKHDASGQVFLGAARNRFIRRAGSTAPYDPYPEHPAYIFDNLGTIW